MNKLNPVFSLAGRVMIALIFVLAGFSLLSALIFHNQLGDQTQFILFMKNVAMAGGFLFLARYGAGELSIDNHRSAAVASTS